MPDDVRALWDEARPGGQNISCMVLDTKGKFVRAFWPLPGMGGRGKGDPFDSEKLGRFLKDEIEKANVPRPETKRTGLTLPTADGAGVRIFLMLRTVDRPMLNYKAPAVEAVTTTEIERKALAYPAKARDVATSELRRWLEQIYPPAIMDSSGKPPAVEGTLTLSPAGESRAILRGEVRFELDDRARTKYRGTLEAVVTYGDSGFASFRGVLEGTFLKPDARGGAVELRLTAAIESTPE